MFREANSVARSLCDIAAATSGERKVFVNQEVAWGGAEKLAAFFWRTLETNWVYRSEGPCNQRTSCRQLAERKPLIILRPIA